MSSPDPLGLSSTRIWQKQGGTSIEHVVVNRPLRRVLAFLGHSIDEVCNDPAVKRKVYGFFRLSKQIDRSAEISDLERQWNPLGLHL